MQVRGRLNRSRQVGNTCLYPPMTNRLEYMMLESLGKLGFWKATHRQSCK